MASLDRFSQGLADAQEEKIMGQCQNCGADLYDMVDYCDECQEVIDRVDAFPDWEKEGEDD